MQGLTETRIAVSWPEPESDHLQPTGYGVKYREQGTNRLENMGAQRHKPGGHNHQPPGGYDLRGKGQRNFPGGNRTLVRDRNRPYSGPSGEHDRGLHQRYRRRNSTVHSNTVQGIIRQRQGEAPMDRGLRRRRNAHRADIRANHRQDGCQDTPEQHQRGRAGYSTDTAGQRIPAGRQRLRIHQDKP